VNSDSHPWHLQQCTIGWPRWLTISHHDLVIETDFDETQRGRVVDETWDAGWDRAAGAADAVGSTVADAWTDATDSVSNAWDDASNVVSDISKGADLATGAVGTVVSNARFVPAAVQGRRRPDARQPDLAS
jgi:hypothetical protein